MLNFFSKKEIVSITVEIGAISIDKIKIIKRNVHKTNSTHETTHRMYATNGFSGDDDDDDDDGGGGGGGGGDSGI